MSTDLQVVSRRPIPASKSSNTFELRSKHPERMEAPAWPVDSEDLLNPTVKECLVDGEWAAMDGNVIKRIDASVLSSASQLSFVQVHGMSGRLDTQASQKIPILREDGYIFDYKLIDPNLTYTAGDICKVGLLTDNAGVYEGRSGLIPASAGETGVAVYVRDRGDGWHQFTAKHGVSVPYTP